MQQISNRIEKRCSSCDNVYNLTCGQISDATFKAVKNGSSNWHCQICRGKGGRKPIVHEDMGSNSSRSIATEIDPKNFGAALNVISAIIHSLHENYLSSVISMNGMNDQILALIQSMAATVDDHDKKIKTSVNENRSENSYKNSNTASRTTFQISKMEVVCCVYIVTDIPKTFVTS